MNPPCSGSVWAKEETHYLKLNICQSSLVEVCSCRVVWVWFLTGVREMQLMLMCAPGSSSRRKRMPIIRHQGIILQAHIGTDSFMLETLRETITDCRPRWKRSRSLMWRSFTSQASSIANDGASTTVRDGQRLCQG